MIQTVLSDFTQVQLGHKKMWRTGTPLEWAAFVKAGYVVNSTLKPIRASQPQMPLALMIPELGRWMAVLRSEVATFDLTDEDLTDFVNNHAMFFSSLKV